MSIGDICERSVVTATKDTSIFEAAKLMRKHNTGNVVIVDNNGEQGKPIGIVTDRDLVIKIIANDGDIKQLNVEDVMKDDLLILKSNQGINEALDMMCAKGVRRAPIVNVHNNIVGIATLDDLLILIAEETGSIAKLIRKQVSSVKKQ